MKIRIAQKIFKLQITFAGGKNHWYNPGLANLLQIGGAQPGPSAGPKPADVHTAAEEAARKATEAIAASGGHDEPIIESQRHSKVPRTGAGGKKETMREAMLGALKGHAGSEPADVA